MAEYQFSDEAVEAALAQYKVGGTDAVQRVLAAAVAVDFQDAPTLGVSDCMGELELLSWSKIPEDGIYMLVKVNDEK